MKTAMLELPAVLVHALKGFDFTDKPLWRNGEGLHHVKVELTFLLNDQPTCVDGWKRKNKPMSVEGRVKRRTEPAPSIGEWPRQSLRANRPQIWLTLPTRPPRQTEPPRCETIRSPATPTIVYQRHEMAPSPSPTAPPVKMPRRDSPEEPMLTDDLTKQQ